MTLEKSWGFLLRSLFKLFVRDSRNPQEAAAFYLKVNRLIISTVKYRMKLTLQFQVLLGAQTISKCSLIDGHLLTEGFVCILFIDFSYCWGKKKKIIYNLFKNIRKWNDKKTTRCPEGLELGWDVMLLYHCLQTAEKCLPHFVLLSFSAKDVRPKCLTVHENRSGAHWVMWRDLNVPWERTRRSHSARPHVKLMLFAFTAQ